MALHTDPGTGVRICVVSCCSASGVGCTSWPWIEFSPTHLRDYDETKSMHSRAHVGGPVMGAVQPFSSVMTVAGRGKGNGVGHRVGLRWRVASFPPTRWHGAVGFPSASTKMHLDVAADELDFVLEWFRKGVRGDEGKRLIAAFTPAASPAGDFDMFPDDGKRKAFHALRKAGRKVAGRFSDSYRMEDTDKAIFDLCGDGPLKCEKRGAMCDGGNFAFKCSERHQFTAGQAQQTRALNGSIAMPSRRSEEGVTIVLVSGDNSAAPSRQGSSKKHKGSTSRQGSPNKSDTVDLTLS